MIDLSQVGFRYLMHHQVGNKHRDEGMRLAEAVFPLNSDIMKGLLLDYFFAPFKIDAFYRFKTPLDGSAHLLRAMAETLFADPMNTFQEQSKLIAEHLYNWSDHPKVKAGELFVTYFTDCLLEEELVTAIGIFKSENKKLFLSTEGELACASGIDIKKLDKGCLIFNTTPEDGYRLLMIDKSSKTQIEKEIWMDDFLGIERIQDSSFDTAAYLELCHDFCADSEAEMNDRKEQVLFLNKTMQYFTEHERFDEEEFEEVVVSNPVQIERFKSFKTAYEAQNEIPTKDDFKISQPAVKTMKRRFRSLIQLDTNIDIRINPKEDPEIAEQLIEKGYDDGRSMYYYKLFFNEEF